MQTVENYFIFPQNRWIADPYAVANHSLLISLSGTLDVREGKSVYNSHRKMDESNRIWERPNWEQKPVTQIQELTVLQ